MILSALQFERKANPSIN